MRGWTTTAAAAIFAGSSLAARSGVQSWDAAVFRRLNRLPDALAPIVWAPMQAGALGAPLCVGGMLWVRGNREAAMRIAVTGAATWVIAKLVKRAVERERPGATIDETVLRIGSADHGLGYPSGHAAVAVTLVSGLSRRRSVAWHIAGLGLVAIVGTSRVYVGAHYPLDAVGGWSLGALVVAGYAAIERGTARRPGS